ncbi:MULTISPECIES: SMP-30/gluconolactonase/LRE family protein [Streptomyces]|uniref:SMP-30/gluconolactonase/LRE family protein n=1 Tax=Streptomyces koelreuteriae TaxID=2838015 RepID=A0ABX8G124_9ACTN|nr:MULTISPECIES: SMP-30/gluconolactonase/LRE family protein [Streptomyces]QWB27186.1 SMP-30/gluconolactonase/LRE family protein [Streptomyces koelreuteriae]UUA10270.1 SMP-30/gluconolactonase/LRE family protein [Streptomyces koelreuteriae]UUA17876.1 SMP-30/gluconolactonase/LRE family protein [Streptomyces sp. CRCS-T-1]
MRAARVARRWRPCVADRYQLAEGARWFDGRLFFVDLLRGDLYSCRESSGGRPEQVLGLGVPLGAVAPAAVGRRRGWIVAAGVGIALTDGRGAPEWLARPGDRADRAMRMNDGVCDPAGRFWAGSMEVHAARDAGSLYRTDPDGTVHEVLDRLTVPNGPAFTADGRLMYLADSARGTITRYAADPVTGALGPPEPFAEFTLAEGRPDGMTVDDHGNLWVALWGGGRVLCLGPDGRRLRTVRLPTPHVSSIAFGGGRMYVTTALHRLERPGLLDGAVLASATAVTAPPALPFGATRPAHAPAEP